MKIALYGATGMIGSRILNEALTRGHEVTAIVRDPSRLTVRHERLTVVVGDLANPDGIAKTAGHDLIISAHGPRPGTPTESVLDVTRALIEGAKRYGVRLITVGGAGSLMTNGETLLIDTPEFPEAWKPIARAHAVALDIYRSSDDLDWTYLSPAALIAPGERTGRFRLGSDQLVIDANGESRISAEDYAVALLDEAENPKHLRQRFTVGY